jgi:hypothetical protein
MVPQLLQPPGPIRQPNTINTMPHQKSPVLPMRTHEDRCDDKQQDCHPDSIGGSQFDTYRQTETQSSR